MKQSAEIYQALIIAPPADVKRVLSAVLRYTRPGNQVNVGAYALRFLLGITARPDGADLLSSKSEEISSLIADVNPGFSGRYRQHSGNPDDATRNEHQTVCGGFDSRGTEPENPQDVIADRMIRPLLTFGLSDPRAVKSALAFLHRDDLTASTRSDLVNMLGTVPGLPEEVNQYLVGRLDDPDPHVRAVAVVSYADSTTAFHTAAKDGRSRGWQTTRRKTRRFESWQSKRLPPSLPRTLISICHLTSRMIINEKESPKRSTADSTLQINCISTQSLQSKQVVVGKLPANRRYLPPFLVMEGLPTNRPGLRLRPEIRLLEPVSVGLLWAGKRGVFNRRFQRASDPAVLLFGCWGRPNCLDGGVADHWHNDCTL